MSDPEVRSINTSRARPSLASHAPKVRRIIQKNVSEELKYTAAIRSVNDKIIASNDSKAISRCFR